MLHARQRPFPVLLIATSSANKLREIGLGRHRGHLSPKVLSLSPTRVVFSVGSKIRSVP